MTELKDIDVQISTNWYGHPSDLPMRLIVYKRKTDNRYHLNWYNEHSGLFWGTYDINEDEIADVLTKKIKSQCHDTIHWNELYFKSPELVLKIEKNLPLFKCCNSIF